VTSAAPPPAAPANASRAHLLLDAAIAVIAEQGLRGLTHRAVDTRAGVPAGSASYYFRSRSALLRGVLSRLLALDAEDYAALDLPDPAGSQLVDRTALVRAWSRLFRRWLGPGRQRQSARYALYLEGRHHPELQEMLDTASAGVRAQAQALLRAAGAVSAQRDAGLLVALLDGILFDQLIRPDPPISAAELRRRIAVVMDAVLPPDPGR
jgi:DNA-binding transcriptional regulator YbjK